MQFSLKKLCVREDSRPLPSFGAMFPAATSTQNVSEPPPVDASMTLGGLPPLRQTEVMVKTEQIDDDDDDNDNDIAGDSNEIVTAFASLDAEAEATDGELPVEFRCRYRRGKCSQPRTLKKNGSMHSYCEHHRLLSIRNQRVFDQKRRRQHEQELGLDGDKPKDQEQRVTATDSSKAQPPSTKEDKRPTRRRRTG